MFLSCYYIDNEFRHNIVIHKFIIYEMRQRTRVGCEQASGGASADQTLEFGGKRRVIGACTHSPKSPMSASKFGTQSGDWWIIIIHDVISVFTSGIDKNQNGGKERRGFSRGLQAFI